MSTNQTDLGKAIVGRLYEAFKAGDVDALDDLLADDFVNHNPQTQNGLPASKLAFATVGPIDAVVHRMIAERDLVAVHAHYKTPAETAGMDFFRVRDGKIIEHWDVVQEIPPVTASGQDMFSELSS